MRIQDKIKGHRIGKTAGSAGVGLLGRKLDDELPMPHHSGYVAAEVDIDPVYDHQKITG
jgi:NADH-quinone oxidoreductase subunit B